MNKSSLKTFAIESRRDLMMNIERTLNLLGINKKGVTLGKPMGEKVEIGGKLYSKRDYDALLRKYKELGYDELLEETAYTWFNRLTALAYMEINSYIDDGLIFSSTTKIAPDIMDSYNDAEFFQNFSEELKEKVHNLRDEHKLEELYSIFVEGKCRELANIMPFMFHKDGGYSELLFPTGLIMEDSLLVKLRKEMMESKDENGNVPVELIGWLYQFYNSEKKDEVFEGLKKNQKITKENIPSATQLFTPKWIVQYMVENSLGKLGVESLGISEELKSKWRYYIESDRDETSEKLKLEDIKIIDPAMGSGHMLTYSFDLLFDIYEDLGWGKRDAVLSILKNNIFGLEIDERAGQLASFALMMKGRERFPRLFKVLERLEADEKFELKTLTIGESNNISQQTKNLMSENNLKNLSQLLENFEDAKEYGSILKLEKLENLEQEFKTLKEAYDGLGQTSLFNSSMEIMERWNVNEDFEKIEKLIEQQKVMTEKFDVVVTNPPYMGNGGMNDTLKKYLKKNYPDSEKDMMTVFMDYAFDIAKRNGFITMINLPSWMFLSSFEELRKKLIDNSTIVSMVDNGRGVFGSDFGSVSFVLKNRYIENYKGTYRRLIKKKGAVESNEVKEEWFLDKEFNKFQANQKDFEKIPGSPIAYWVSDRVKEIFENGEILKKTGDTRQGMATSDNNKFLKEWFEVNTMKIGFGYEDEKSAEDSLLKWFPYNKGGEYRKWFGNQEFIINYEKNGLEVKQYSAKLYKSYTRTIKSIDRYFQPSISWSKITSGGLSLRYFQKGFIFDVAGCSIYGEDKNLKYLLAILNSKLKNVLIGSLSPTLNFEAGQIAITPIIFPKLDKIKEKIEKLTQQNIDISKQEWDSRETSWDFETSPLLGGTSMESAYHSYCNTWRENFYQMHSNEEELNRLFIEIYGLESEMDEKVDLEDITLLKKESKIIDGELVFNPEEITKQFLSYGVGCIMGRYSLDKKGLIIANSDDEILLGENSFKVMGEDGELRHEITNPKFLPEPFGIIPVVRENIFSNDIVEKIVEFVKSVYGEATLEENLEFIGNSLGMKTNETPRDTIRKYFLKDFYKDHLQRYKKRPIYWMMKSGKRDAFSSLIYLHRYESNTVGRVRADYLVKYQETLDRYKDYYDRILTDTDTIPKDKKEAEKKLKELDGDLKELRDYANEVKHIADQKIILDLDDGVKINYEKFGKILGKI